MKEAGFFLSDYTRKLENIFENVRDYTCDDEYAKNCISVGFFVSRTRERLQVTLTKWSQFPCYYYTYVILI